MSHPDSAKTTEIEPSAGNAADSAENKVPTVDGTRIEFDEINVGAPGQEAKAVSGNWMQRARSRLSLFLAGMYTGIGCSGVPHSHHTYGHDRDKRPL
jgi:hypothetical protein